RRSCCRIFISTCRWRTPSCATTAWSWASAITWGERDGVKGTGPRARFFFGSRLLWQRAQVGARYFRTPAGTTLGFAVLTPSCAALAVLSRGSALLRCFVQRAGCGWERAQVGARYYACSAS